jgi:asparagine synthase (glutamine-hydrolysing)
VSEERIIWSSELAPLLDLAGIELEPNDIYIAGYFTHGPEPKLTPYKDIYAVPPGNVISISEGQLQEQRFWGLDQNHEIRYKNDAEYEQHFLHLFREAVRCRLRADRPVWSELSGGLDSSSIVCIADQIIKSGEVQIPPLETVSHIYDESLTCDESKFIHYVEEHRGKAGHHLPESTYRVLAPFADEASVVIPNIVHIGADYHRGLCEAMRENGARMLLTGQGGDQLLCSAPNPAPELADLLFQRKPLQLHRRLQEWSHALKRPYLELLWKNAVLPTMPVRIQALFQRGGPCSLPEWIDQNFARRMNLHERMLGGMDIFGFQTPSGRDQSAGFLSVVRLISAGYRRERTDIEISYPYLHRPLVEFLQAIPHEQRIRPGETRSLMRRALRNVLPDEIARRKSKGRPTEAILRAVIREWPRLQLLFENARVSDYGYVNSEKLLLSLSLARTGNKNAITLVNRVIALEFWLRSLEGRRSGAKKGATVTREHAFPITAAQTGAVAVAAH